MQEKLAKCNFLNKANLVNTLEGKGTFTVFAPTDDAFKKLPAGTLENLLKPENKDKSFISHLDIEPVAYLLKTIIDNEYDYKIESIDEKYDPFIEENKNKFDKLLNKQYSISDFEKLSNKEKEYQIKLCRIYEKITFVVTNNIDITTISQNISEPTIYIPDYQLIDLEEITTNYDNNQINKDKLDLTKLSILEESQ